MPFVRRFWNVQPGTLRSQNPRSRRQVCRVRLKGRLRRDWKHARKALERLETLETKLEQCTFIAHKSSERSLWTESTCEGSEKAPSVHCPELGIAKFKVSPKAPNYMFFCYSFAARRLCISQKDRAISLLNLQLSNIVRVFLDSWISDCALPMLTFVKVCIIGAETTGGLPGLWIKTLHRPTCLHDYPLCLVRTHNRDNTVTWDATTRQLWEQDQKSINYKTRNKTIIYQDATRGSWPYY